MLGYLSSPSLLAAAAAAAALLLYYFRHLLAFYYDVSFRMNLFSFQKIFLFYPVHSFQQIHNDYELIVLRTCIHGKFN